MNMKALILFSAMAVCSLTACNIISPENDPITYGESYIPNLMSTDKAAYKPGQTVTFTINTLPEQTLKVRYKHLGKTLSEQNVSSNSWTWQPPKDDFKGYMAELVGSVNGKDSVFDTIAIDVSSEPSRLPRNGFLSAYGNLSASEISTTLNELNR